MAAGSVEAQSRSAPTTSNLPHLADLALVMKPDVETRSTYRRLQRVFAGFAFDYAGRIRGVFTSICGGPFAWSRLRLMDRRRLKIIEPDQLGSAVIAQNQCPTINDA